MKYPLIITTLLVLVLNSSCDNNQPEEAKNKVATTKTETIINNDLANEGLKGKVKAATITMYVNVTINKDSSVILPKNSNSVTNMYDENGFLTSSEMPDEKGNKSITKYVTTTNGSIDAQIFNTANEMMMHILIKRDGDTILQETYKPGDVLVSKEKISLNNKYLKEKTEKTDYSPGGDINTIIVSNMEFDADGNKIKSSNTINANTQSATFETHFITQEKDKYNNPTKVLSFTTSPMGEMAMYITTEYEYYK